MSRRWHWKRGTVNNISRILMKCVRLVSRHAPTLTAVAADDVGAGPLGNAVGCALHFSVPARSSGLLAGIPGLQASCPASVSAMRQVGQAGTLPLTGARALAATLEVFAFHPPRANTR